MKKPLIQSLYFRDCDWRRSDAKRPMKVTDHPHRNNIRVIGQLLLIALYLVSLFLPAIEVVPENGGGLYSPRGWLPGLACLLFPCCVPWLVPPWWANLCFFTGMVRLKQNQVIPAFWWGMVATFVSLTIYVVPTVTALGPGYYTWVGCMIGLMLLAFHTHLK